MKNNEEFETTPSAVWEDRRQRLHVGRAAKERAELDPQNTCVEFKRMMGTTGSPKKFRLSGRTMEPEELSAEVLKSLRGDVEQRLGEHIQAAVVTVPAAFPLNACDATRRAAELANLTHAPLLQEPIAAAFAYGFQSKSDNVFWLVYDLGGGTFDAAVIHVRDGEFSVVNHKGDNSLGGKNIDWDIVERLLIPAAVHEHNLTDFGRGNPRWNAAIAKLKGAAEKAKIQLSRADSADIFVEFQDDNGEPVEFEHELRRRDVERITEPYITRSINLCKQALAEGGVAAGDVEKVLLVGGPTLAPYVRERLADATNGLGIPLDHSQDPVTVVARGAAIFAGTQRLPALAAEGPPSAGEYTVELEYRPVGPDPEPFVGGRVIGDEAGLDGFALEFVDEEAQPPWRSGKIALSPNGAFMATLWAERGRENSFRIELTDPSGARRKISPSRLTYTVGIVPTQPPLTHSIGVGLENNEVLWLVEKGAALPARQRARLRTTVAMSRGLSGGVIRIPVLEGEYSRADRNRKIGCLEVRPSQIRRDVPEGSEVEFTIEIDESRMVLASAYVPLLDEEFEHSINLETETIPDHERLAIEAGAERHRLEEVRRRASEVHDSRADAVLRRIDGEEMPTHIDRLVEAARIDNDAALTCGELLRDLKAAIDEVEEALEWPLLVRRSDELLPVAREIVAQGGDAGHRQALTGLEATIRSAINARNADLLRQRLGELRVLVLQVLNHTGDLPRLAFRDLRERRDEMRDPAEASRLVTLGDQAAASGDITTLRSVNDDLEALLPASSPPPDPFSRAAGPFSTVTDR